MTPPLTFGVELEFSLALIDPNTADPHPKDPRPLPYLPNLTPAQISSPYLEQWGGVDLVAKKLQAGGLKVDIDNPGDEKPDHWQIVDDLSVRADLERKISDGYHWDCVEVVSPVFYFCEENLKEVELACKIITANFRVVNFQSSGLHVHIGNGKHGFHLETVKKLMSFLWAFSPQMDTLHTRRDVFYAGSLRSVSKLWGEIYREAESINPLTNDIHFPDPPSWILSGIHKIYSQKRMVDLAKLCGVDGGEPGVYYPNCAYMEYFLGNLTIDMGGENRLKKTVEWRQHAGTVEGEAVVAWIRTAVGITESILEFEDEVLHNMFAEIVRREIEGEEQPDIYDILDDLGLDQAANYYRKTEAVRDAIRAGKVPIEELPHYRKYQKAEKATNADETGKGAGADPKENTNQESESDDYLLPESESDDDDYFLDGI